ncbi:MAG: NTP transferase domain-containing protein [Desulfobacterales bacterium]|nr:NTP transferase domain-containing protein [Desulfobacterales bacterium]
MVNNKITALILAAGYSSRMGTFKPLLNLGGITVIERVIRLFQSAGIADIRVVTGYRSTELQTLSEQAGARSIFNERFEQGMFSSVAAGIRSLEPDREAFFVLPADIPLVRLGTLLDLLNAYHLQKGNITYPVFQDTRGHPPLISACYAKKIESWNGQGGLRAFLEQYEKHALDVDVADECILLDADTPEDYQKLLSRCKQYDIPTKDECMALMNKIFRVENHIIEHCREVARVALVLGKELNRNGCETDLDLVSAGALLHDLARKKPCHATAGAKILNDLGYPRVAEVVGTHADIHIRDHDPVSASEVVCLADKLVQGNRIVSLETRFEGKMNRYADNPRAKTGIENRLKNALRMKQRLEKIIGRPLEAVLQIPVPSHEQAKHEK